MKTYLKLIIASIIGVLLLIPGTSMAHGSGHHGNSDCGTHNNGNAGYGVYYNNEDSHFSYGDDDLTNGKSNQSDLPICEEESCRITYNHTHDGEFYCGHYNGDGHTHNYSVYTRTSCNIDGCELTYNHTHNNRNYYGHHNEDGHNHNFSEEEYQACPAYWCRSHGVHCHAGTYYN